jgi:hypothetical protein
MSNDITVTVKRGGTAVAGIPELDVQLDNAGSPGSTEANYNGGVQPFMRFDAYVYGNWDLRQSDLFVDTTNIDPVTGNLKQYRIVNLPESFPDSHTEVLLDLVRGD